MFALAAIVAVALVVFADGTNCVPPGGWMAPGSPPRPLDAVALLDSVTKQRVVLLGEAHDNAAHHRWQLQTLTALHAAHPDMVLGFEAFPRRAQPALDRWTAGDLSESDFLKATAWREVWGMDPQLYMPLFEFARKNRIPLAALNVDRELVRAVRDKGFDAVDPVRREGVTTPAVPIPAYVDLLFPVFAAHGRAGSKAEKPTRDSAQFRRFVETQTVWDRAMAQGIADALAARPGTLVVGIMGYEHAARGYGVPYQLADLGVRDAAILLPWDRRANCAELNNGGLADAVFGVL
jgi:uncharacterized iron-regulated protein